MKGNKGKAPPSDRLPYRDLPRLVTKHVNYRPTQLTPANDDKLTRAASQRIRFWEWLRVENARSRLENWLESRVHAN